MSRAFWALLCCAELACAARREGQVQEPAPRRALAVFKRLKVTSALHVSVRPGPCTLSGLGDGRQARVDAVIVDEALTLSLPSTRAGLEEPPSFELEVETPALEAIEATDGSEVAAVVRPTATFEANASAGAQLVISQIDADAVLVRVTTGATALVDGRARALTILASSGGFARAGQLATEVLELDASGEAEVEAQVSDRVSGTLSTGAVLTVRGSPRTSGLVVSTGASAHVSP